MDNCYTASDFKNYFNENMTALGLPVPSTLFDSFNAAVANAGLILETIHTLGKVATMAEVIRATTGLEKLKVVASLGAAYYVGAVIGSIAVASGRLLGCGSRIADVFVLMRRNDLLFDGWYAFYAMNPEILSKNHRMRQAYFSRALSASKRAIA